MSLGSGLGMQDGSSVQVCSQRDLFAKQCIMVWWPQHTFIRQPTCTGYLLNMLHWICITTHVWAHFDKPFSQNGNIVFEAHSCFKLSWKGDSYYLTWSQEALRQRPRFQLSITSSRLWAPDGALWGISLLGNLARDVKKVCLRFNRDNTQKASLGTCHEPHTDRVKVQSSEDK